LSHGDELLPECDLGGTLIWLAIVRATERLQAQTTAETEALY
jgi:hypothetical protein